MIVVNLTTEDIVLPTRHRLRAGAEAALPPRVTGAPANREFLATQVYLGRLSLAEPLPAPPAPGPVDPAGLPVSRVTLALMSHAQLIRQAVRIGFDKRAAEAAREDDLRLEVAERMFGP